MRKAKKKMHPMPKLGWKDMMLYWSGIVLTGGGALAAILVPFLVRKDIAFANPDVVASDCSQASLHNLWLTLWLITVCCLIMVPYHNRFPVFGRSDVKYGPPAYPRIFPLLMKDPPQYWESPKKVARRKQLFHIGAIILSLWLIISIWVYPCSVYERTDLYQNGSIVLFNGSNQEECYYRYSDVESIGFRADYHQRRKSYTRHWYVEMIINLRDGEQIIYRNNEFRGEQEDVLRAMLSYKERYSGLITITGMDELEKVADYYHMTEAERELLYLLFE